VFLFHIIKFPKEIAVKNLLVILSAMLLVFGFVGFANAALIDLSNGVTKDDRNTSYQYDDQYWIQDLDLFDGLTYDEQISAISNFNINELSNVAWHMATSSDIINLQALYPIMGTPSPGFSVAFLPNEVAGDLPIWNGRYDRVYPSSNPFDPNAPYHYLVAMWVSSIDQDRYHFSASSHSSDSSTSKGAFVVGSVADPIPIPGAVWLLGSGLIGIVGIRRKIKK